MPIVANINRADTLESIKTEMRRKTMSAHVHIAWMRGDRAEDAEQNVASSFTELPREDVAAAVRKVYGATEGRE